MKKLNAEKDEIRLKYMELEARRLLILGKILRTLIKERHLNTPEMFQVKLVCELKLSADVSKC